MHIPVLILGQRRDGREYERSDYLRVEVLRLGLIRQSHALSDQDKLREAKREFLGRLQVLRTVGGQTLLMETSGEVYNLDRDREFMISSQAMKVSPTGEVVLRTAM